MSLTHSARIIGTGHYLPHKTLNNQELADKVDTSDEWIKERTGISQRHIANDEETTAYMATEAAKNALQMAKLQPNQIDLILVATTTADRVFPSVACEVQQQLGIENNCPAFDLQAVCSGFVYALSTADQFIKTGFAKRILVIGSESMSKIIDWNDRTTCILFGDGAGAVILEASEQADTGILSTHLYSEGRQGALLCTEPSQQFGDEPSYIHMQGRPVFKEATRALGELVTETLEANQLNDADLDWLIPHQANLRIIQATAKKLKMPMSQVIVTVDNHANTSAASIPLALDVGVRDGRIKPGQLLLLEAFGGGFTWGSALIRY